MMMNYSRLFRNPTPIRRIINPDEWVANVSRVLVQERWCETGKAICNGDIAGKIIQGMDLSLFRQHQLETMVAVFDKYPGSLGNQARRRLINHSDSLQRFADHRLPSMAEKGPIMTYRHFESSLALSSPLHRIDASVAELPPTGDAASRSSIGLPSVQAHHPVLWSARPVRFRRNVAASPATPEVSRQSPETSSWFRQAAQLVAQMSCQSITSEQVIKGIDSALGYCLTGAGARRTPVASDTRAQVDDAPHWISRC